MIAALLSVDGDEPREVVSLNEAESSGGDRFATWTPDGKHLLYSKRQSEIWRVNIGTKEQEQIGPKIDGLSLASMHPDGKSIAFTTSKMSAELWVMKDFLPK